MTAPGRAGGRLAGVALVATSAIAFGALGVLARVAYDDGADPVGVLAVRFPLAALVLGVLRLARPRPRPRGRALAGLLAMGVGYFLQGYCYFQAVEHAPPGLVALLLYTYPALVVALGAVVLRLPVGRPVAMACAVALAGTALIVGPSASGGSPTGIAFALGAAFVYAGYILLGSKVLARVDPLWATTVIMAAAGVCILALHLSSSPRPALPGSGEGWLAVVAIALLCTVLAGMTFLAGLARVGPADASTISTLEPVVSVVLSAVVVGESITGWTVAGGLLVGTSVVVLSRLPTPAPLAEPAAHP